ncbi:MAG: hypothetical protein GY870_20370 [archaeon]|nr:hypothetical protein [archaeon]
MKRDSLRCIKSINFENKVKNLAVLIFIVISFSGLNIVSLKESDVNNNEFSNETKNKLFIEESIPKVADISEEQPFEQQITIYNASQFDVSENVYYLSNTQDLALNDENLTFGIPENWESSQAIIDVSSLYQESEIFEDGNMNGNFTGTINPWQTKTNYPYSGIPSIPSANFNYHNYASEDYANITFYEPYNYNSLYGFYENSNSTFNKEDKEVEIGELYESERQVFPILNGFSSDPFYPSGEYVKLDNGDIYSNNTDKMVSTVSVDHLSGISAIRNQILTADSQLDRRRGDPSVASGLNFFVPFEADKITVTFCWAVENNQYSYLDGFKVKASINNQFIDGRYDENGQLYSSSDIEGDFNSLEVDNEPGEENNHVWETRSYNITELVGDFGYRKGWHSLDFGCYMEHPEYLGGDVNVYWDYVIINVTHYDWYKAAELDFDYLLEDLGFFNDKYFFDSKSFVIYFGDGDGDTDNLYRYYINETSDLPEASGWLNRINQEIVIPHTYMEAFQVNNFTFKVGLESNRKDYYIPGGMSLMTNFEKRLSIDNFSLNINFKIINDEDFTDIDLNAKINTDPWIDIPNLNQNWCSINFGPPNLNISFRINSSSYSTVPEPRMRFSAAIKARKFTENVSESSVILNDISQSYCIWNTTFNTTDSINEISNDSSIFSNNLFYYYNFTIENLPAFDGLGTSSQDWNIKELYCPLNQNLTTAIIKSSSYPFLQNVSAISGTYLYNEYLVNGTWTFLAEQTNYMTNGTIYHIDYTPIEKFYNGNDTFFDLNVRNSTDINGNYNVTIFNSSIYAVNTSYYGNDADENRTINWKVIDTGVGIYRLFTTWNDTNSDNQTKRFGWYTDNFEIWRKTTCRIHPTEKEQEIGSIFDYEIEFNYSINGLSNAIENASLSAYNNETGNEWGKDWIPTYDFVSYTQSGDNYSIYLETISIPSGDYKVRFLLEKDYYDIINWTDCVWVKIVGVLSNFTIEFLSGVHENPSGSEDLTLDLSNIPYVNDSSTSIIQINVTNSSSNREKIRDAIITGKFNGSDTIMIGYEQYQYPYDEQDKGIYNLVLNTTGLNHTDQINFKNYTLEISIGRTNFTSVINTTSVYIKKLPLIIEEESISNIYEGESIEIQATVSKNNTGVLNPCYSASVFYSLFNSTDDSYLFV